MRDRLYESYASQHSGPASAGATRVIYRRDIRPLLPPPSAGPIVDIGCGAGQLVRCLLADGYDPTGIDISPEQVALARSGRSAAWSARETTVSCSENAPASWLRSPRPTCSST